MLFCVLINLDDLSHGYLTVNNTRNTIALANKGIVATYTNLPEFIKDIKDEIRRKR